MNALNDLIKDTEFFIDMPDCIADGGSYKDTIEEALKLINEEYQLESFQWEQVESKYKLCVQTKSKKIEFEVSIMSHYIDGHNLCIGLNKMLSETEYKGIKNFVSISGETVDFAVAFITTEKDLELREKGLNFN